ncbi:MAG TPA: menaquinol-cytochrome c reductase cytochrome b subunit [Actinomycetota bacterium]|nr:menaquinol-cytochrome c reductase cytochrome b subunit [Actinomycetota bacterium]
MPTPDEIYDQTLAEENAKGSSPAVAEARAKAARHRARKAAAAGSAPPKPPAAPAEKPAAAAAAPEPASVGATAPAAAAAPPAASAPATPAAPAAPAGGRRAAARAGVGAGDAAPERIQRLLAVVKPESIQRVEKEPIDRVNTWPHLMAGEFLAILAVTAFLVLTSVFVDAELRELANINVTPNPSKAPWYFLGLQELLRYFHPQVAGVTIPQWIILGLMAAPYIDRNPSNKPGDRKLAISLWTIFMLMFAILGMLGSIFRGPGFNFVYPWDAGIFFEL